MKYLMKGLLKVLMAAILFGMTTMTGCKDPANATIHLQVVDNAGKPAKEVKVGMYQAKKLELADTDILVPKDYALVKETDTQGLVEFTVNRLSVGDDGIYCVFEAFDDNNVYGRVSTYVSAGCLYSPLTLTLK